MPKSTAKQLIGQRKENGEEETQAKVNEEI